MNPSSERRITLSGLWVKHIFQELMKCEVCAYFSTDDENKTTSFRVFKRVWKLIFLSPSWLKKLSAIEVIWYFKNITFYHLFSLISRVYPVPSQVECILPSRQENRAVQAQGPSFLSSDTQKCIHEDHVGSKRFYHWTFSSFSLAFVPLGTILTYLFCVKLIY